jgi:hypothetical protein
MPRTVEATRSDRSVTYTLLTAWNMAYRIAAQPWCTILPLALRWLTRRHHLRANSLTQLAVVIWRTKCDAQHDDAIVRAVATQRVAAFDPQ